ncbi:UNVERIFIED_CONTAM: hypothetical protein Sradi_1275100 [Sesamum radiatum]|uniref:Uncharacterized protein n=1 Tax=Sesamum radiatum TaxID=300843 RepID=A0AAW2UTE8_SESRA
MGKLFLFQTYLVYFRSNQYTYYSGTQATKLTGEAELVLGNLYLSRFILPTSQEWKQNQLYLFKDQVEDSLITVGHLELYLLLCLFIPILEMKDIPIFPTPSRVSWRGGSCNVLQLTLHHCLPTVGLLDIYFLHLQDFSNDLHFSSSQQQEKHPRQPPFISQSANSGSSVLVPHSVDSGVLQSTASSHYNKDHNDSWCTDALPDFLDFPMSGAIQNSQLDGSNTGGVAVPSEDPNRPNDWQDWADQLITDNDALTSDWNELLADTSVADPDLKVELFLYA